MTLKRAYILPILCPVWFVLTFIITYTVSVFKENIYPIFSYISDTGTWSPESCIFGLLVNLGAIIQGLIVYIRYRQVQYFCDKESFKPPVRKLNGVAFVAGILAVCGVCILANFQETNVLAVHLLGAGIAFGIGSLYLWMQTHISFKIYPILGNKKINIARVGFATICSLTLFATTVFGAISFIQFTGDDISKWTEEDGGYLYHSLSVVAEWILVLSVILFLGLFAQEFKQISITEPFVGEATSDK